MALINCPECNHQVSDAASACPNCGFGLSHNRETRAAGANLKTVQLTSKKFKLQQLLALFLFCVGLGLFIVSVGAGEEAGPGVAAFSVLAMFAGMVWTIVTRIRIWWHHE